MRTLFVLDRSRYLCASVIVSGFSLLLGASASGQVASALIQEDTELPGAPGQNIDSLSNTAVNQVGGYAVTTNTSGPGGTLSYIWGNLSGGAGGPIRVEGTFGDLTQLSYESFFGISNDNVAYGTTSNDAGSGAMGLDGVWYGDTVVLNEQDPVANLPGFFSSFNSRPGATTSEPYWVGGITSVQGESTENRVLFYSTQAIPIIMGGDFVTGVAEPLDPNNNIGFDVRFAPGVSGLVGTVPHYITDVIVQASSATDAVMIIDGDAIFTCGEIIREGDPVAADAGGLVAELWSSFDSLGINDNGHYFITGNTDADSAVSEFVLVDGEIVLREGTQYVTMSDILTIDGAIEGGYFNSDRDWAVTWDVENQAAVNFEVLIYNGEIVLSEGDLVDWNNDGVVDGADNNGKLADFTGITSLTLSDRDVNNEVTAYFTADIDFNGTPSTTDDIEGFMALTLDAGALPCDADFTDANGGGPDGNVDVFDLLGVLDNFGSPGGSDVTGGSTNTPQNCTTDVFDLLQVLDDFGACP